MERTAQPLRHAAGWGIVRREPGAGTAARPEQADEPRRVLMVMFHFPPLGGVPMPRNVRNTQHLPRLGWTPVVVAPADAEAPIDRDSLALVAPGTKVLRTRLLGPRTFGRVVAMLRTAAAKGGRGSASRPGGPQNGGRRNPPPSLFWRLRRLVFFPDDAVGWLPFAVVAALRAHHEQRFDAVYSTSSPVTAHLVAGVFKRLTGVAWVAEFRDPWVGNPAAEPLPRLRRRVQARLERWIVGSADRLVFLSPSTASRYRRRYPLAREMVTITNGHDRGEAPVHVDQASTRGRFRLVWAGTLYRPGELRLFLEALRELAGRRPTLAQELEVAFYGHVSTECRTVADVFVDAAPLREIVSFPGIVSRRAALEALASADAALVMLGPGPGMGQFVPGKLFDAIGQNRQVLAILPPGDARDILAELGWGVIAEPNTTDIGRALEQLLETQPPDRVADPEGRYDRLVLAGRLADTLRAAVDEAPRRAVRQRRRTRGISG